MIALKSHISFKVLALFVVTTLLLPASHKLAHLFEHHEHKVCNGDASTHFHQVDLDCDFQKFHVNQTYAFTHLQLQLYHLQETPLVQVSPYCYLSKHQHFPFSLRATPHFT
ncbi:hypothetical protein [Tamlana crocina]|uniref:Uncharacterized protein n=1 Tax=Tamlana crocina TaxID=393006 RepID=A0ABX1DGZ6_9FLAO|nr:hypothetical protein [Tamlana crocina]NJX16278.1 hypothetical protein [Tamlana crocina]